MAQSELTKIYPNASKLIVDYHGKTMVLTFVG